MSETTQQFLPDLLDLSREATDFYVDAAKKVDDTRLRQVFTRMAEAKSQLATDLGNEIKASAAKRRKAPEWVDEAHATYGVLSKNLKKAGLDQITRLEATETVLQHRMHDVLMDRDNSYLVRVMAKQYLSKAEVLNKELRGRKRDLA